MFDTVLFDLDGTLTDPFEGITNSIVYALKKFGIEVADKRTLIDFIGPPLLESFSSRYGFAEDMAQKAVEYYREYFSQKGIFENRVYSGVEDMLKALKFRGVRILLATSKPQPFAERILAHFKLSEYFDFVAGASFGKERSQKADVIAYAIESGKVNVESAVMVGDRKHDVLGAKANGLKSIGVLYGYGSRDELLKSGADFLANEPADILKLIR